MKKIFKKLQIINQEITMTINETTTYLLLEEHRLKKTQKKKKKWSARSIVCLVVLNTSSNFGQ